MGNKQAKVLHLVDDLAMGGVNVALASLMESELNTEYDFASLCVCFRSPRQWWRALRAIKQHQADIICLHYAANWSRIGFTLLLRLCFSGRIALQEHHYSRGFVEHNVKTPKRFYWMLKLMYRSVDRVLCISVSQRLWMLEQQLISADRLIFVGQGCQRLNLLAVTPKPLEQPLVVGAYGRFNQQKGFDILVQAATLLDPALVQLKIAGEGPQYAQLRALAEDSDNIEFIGKVDDIALFMQQVDIVAIPSRWEPFGLTCMESLLAGKPVMISLADGLPEQVDYLLAANLVQAWPRFTAMTPVAFAAAISQTVNQLQARESRPQSLAISSDARQRVAQSWPALIQRWRLTLMKLAD
ncbi:glycosyltransferase family 4 protein [Shewanella waksmanii]|uniref:glycosyltransferase family 4 protein n=1 Tax=Shewanella waksmanii TaxID=213783 RepID=UPI0004B47EFB|nr:glycosyltransferase family 4 protein [Shewanella waksmanii]